MEKKTIQGSLADRIPAKVWVLLSFLAAMLLWWILSIIFIFRFYCYRRMLLC